MQPRKEFSIKNVSETGHRPGRQFLDVIKSMLEESRNILPAHPIYYRTAKACFDTLVEVYHDIESPLLRSEQTRPDYQRSPQLMAAYDSAVEEVRVATVALQEIETDAVKKQWEDQIAQLMLRMHQAQMDFLKKQRANDIDVHRRLRAEEARLYQIRQEGGRYRLLCIPSKKYKLAQKKLMQQMKVVEHLEELLNTHEENPELLVLQNSLDKIYVNIKEYSTRKVKMQYDAYDVLKAARLQLTKIEAAINDEQKHYYSNIDNMQMHGIIRLYDRFITYKIDFDAAVKNKISNKDEAAIYQQMLNATKNRLDQLMEQFWCGKYERLNAKGIYEQLSKMSYTNCEKLLNHKPDSDFLEQMMSMATVSTSTMGLFKKPLPSTDKLDAPVKQSMEAATVSLNV